MNRKIVLSILACIILSMGIFMASSIVEYGSTSSEPTMSVVPAVFCNHVVDVGETFALNFTVADVVDLYSWQIKVYFDPTILSITPVELENWLPSDHVFSYTEGTGGLIFLNPVIGDDYLFWGCSLVGTTLPRFNGTGRLCQINFTAVGPGVSTVELDDEGSILVDSNTEMIPSVKVDTFIDVGGQISPRTWIVDDDGPADFQSIQEAINAAACGDEIYVKTGTYYENVIVDKTISLSGEGATIDASDSVVWIDAPYVVFSGFIVRNGREGIVLADSMINVTRNELRNNFAGITTLSGSSNNLIIGNVFNRSEAYAIQVQESSNNLIYHNCFVENTKIWYFGAFGNVWDNGYPSGGNYWSDYEERYPYAQEVDNSGIWDTPYVICENNVDRYPLVNPWTPPPQKFDVTWGEGIGPYYITFFCNDIVTSFKFKPGYELDFTIIADDSGICNITIPRCRLDSLFSIYINGTWMLPWLWSNETESESILRIKYYSGINHVKIVGTERGYIVGDLNGDGKVDIKDIFIVAANWQHTEEDYD